MAKKLSSFVCQECGYDSPQWMGKCPECGLWNSMKEIKLSPSTSRLSDAIVQASVAPQTLKEISAVKKERIQTAYEELNMVLGGGIVLGSVLLLAGDPGVGKSTLLLQLCMSLAAMGKRVLYISGEESVDQVKMRAERITTPLGTKNIEKRTAIEENLYLVSLTNPDQAISQIEEMKPDFVVIDSIQTMQSENVAGLSGSVAQIRYGALHYVRIAKTLNIPLIMVGHVTKEGNVAGPMLLSHMVDTVLFLEGEKFTSTRILRSLKNRFGPVDEVGIFLMEEVGMKEVRHPEQLFLSGVKENVPGNVLVATLEGSRPFLVELQALVVSSKLAMPRRVVSGIDQRRLELLLAVLQKHARLPVETMDVFVNVAGGMRLSDPSIDLGVCLAVYSSLRNIPISTTVGIAEVGLLGELRTVTSLEKRVREANRLGFDSVVTAKTHPSLVAVLKAFQKTGENAS